MAQADIEKPATIRNVASEIAFGFKADCCIWTNNI
jgi:hypothetical protein